MTVISRGKPEDLADYIEKHPGCGEIFDAIMSNLNELEHIKGITVDGFSEFDKDGTFMLTIMINAPKKFREIFGLAGSGSKIIQ